MGWIPILALKNAHDFPSSTKFLHKAARSAIKECSFRF